MGSVLLTFGFSDKANTVSKAVAEFEERAAHSRYEDGHSYSGCIGMLQSLRDLDRTFDSVDDFEEFLMHQHKDQGFLARIPVIRETKPLIKARQAYHPALTENQLAKGFLNSGNKGRVKGKDGTYKDGTPAQIARVIARTDKIIARYRDLRAKQISKSKKTRFIGGGWASS